MGLGTAGKILENHLYSSLGVVSGGRGEDRVEEGNEKLAEKTGWRPGREVVRVDARRGK